MAQFITIPPFAPEGALSNPVRALGPPLQSGTVVVDTYYSATDPLYARWLYVGTTGNINYMKWDGTTQVITNVAAGVWHPIPSLQILAASTTAGGLVWGQ